MNAQKRSRFSRPFVFAALFSCSLLAAAQSGPAILHAAEAGKLLPDSVYYAGKSAGTQLRNSAGIQFPGGHYTLAVLVDTSGYSTAVAQKYQGYLLTEVPLEFGGHRLPAGAYGFGFVSGHFGVMDIGNNDVLQASATHDQQMKRPVPLQIMDAGSGGYRLCSGRDCVVFRRAE
jgi:hypothetical protein